MYADAFLYCQSREAEERATLKENKGWVSDIAEAQRLDSKLIGWSSCKFYIWL